MVSLDVKHHVYLLFGMGGGGGESGRNRSTEKEKRLSNPTRKRGLERHSLYQLSHLRNTRPVHGTNSPRRDMTGMANFLTNSLSVDDLFRSLESWPTYVLITITIIVSTSLLVTTGPLLPAKLPASVYDWHPSGLGRSVCRPLSMGGN